MQPDLQLVVDGIQYWQPESFGDAKRFKGLEKSFTCYAAVTEINFGTHSLSIEQVGPGSIQAGFLLIARPQLAIFNGLLYILVTLAMWTPIIFALLVIVVIIAANCDNGSRRDDSRPHAQVLPLHYYYPVTSVESEKPAAVSVHVEAEESSPKAAEATEKTMGNQDPELPRYEQ